MVEVCVEELKYLKNIDSSLNKLLGLSDPFYVPDDRFKRQTQVGLSETAQRVGAPLLYDRRGEVIWYDDFEAPVLRWRQVLSGTGAAVALSSANAHFGDQSVLMTAGTTVNKLAELIQYTDVFGARRIGLAVSLSWVSAPASHNFSIILAKIKNGTLYYGELNVSPDLGTVYYYNAAGAYVAYKGLPYIYTGIGAWYNFKLVVDFDKNEYVRLLFADKELDLASIPLNSSASGLTDQMYVDIINYGVAGSNVAVYLDDVVVTLNEPKGG